MIFSQRNIILALILLFMLSALGIAGEQAAEEEIEVSRLLDEIKFLIIPRLSSKKDIVCLKLKPRKT